MRREIAEIAIPLHLAEKWVKSHGWQLVPPPHRHGPNKWVKPPHPLVFLGQAVKIQMELQAQ